MLQFYLAQLLYILERVTAVAMRPAPDVESAVGISLTKRYPQTNAATTPTNDRRLKTDEETLGIA